MRNIKGLKKQILGMSMLAALISMSLTISGDAAQREHAAYVPELRVGVTGPSAQICDKPGEPAAIRKEEPAAIRKEEPATIRKEGENSMDKIMGPLNTELPADTELFVTVEGKGLRARVSAYKREKAEDGSRKDSFELVLSTDEGFLGRQGLGKTREGDDKTPLGLFKMNTPFGINDREEGFPDNYLKLDDRYYWNGDSESDRYNQLVNIDEYKDFNTKESEHLIEVKTCYNYSIDTGYNIEGEPYKGSALFLHCERGINTAGCIAIREEYMKEILKLYEEGRSYIRIVEAE